MPCSFFLLLTGSLVALVGTWKSRIDITMSKPWNTDRTVINGLLNQFWRSQESPKPSVPYRLKWEPAYCISIVFFLWIPLWVYVFFLPTPCNVFLWNVFHKWFAQTSCVIWDALTKLLFLWVQEKKKNVIFKRQTFFLGDSQTSSVAPYCSVSILLVLKLQ